MLQLDKYASLANKTDNFKIGQFLYCEDNSDIKNLILGKINLPEPVIDSINSICKEDKINILALFSVAVRSVFYEILGIENLGIIMYETEKYLFVNKIQDRSKTFKELLIDNKNSLISSIKMNKYMSDVAKEQASSFKLDDHIILSVGKEFNKDVFETLNSFIYILLDIDQNNIIFTFTKNTYDEDRVNEIIKLVSKYIAKITSTKESLDNYSSIIYKLFNNEKSLIESESNYVNFLRLEKLFEQTAQENSEKICLVIDEVEYTYSQLNKDSDRLAKEILKIVTPGDIVGIHLEKSYALFVAILGIMKSGCAYVPLDIAWPISRKQYIAEDSKMSIAITDYLIDIPCKIVGIEELMNSTKNLEKDFKLPNFGLNSYAYFIYTSGTTGNPKKIGICHYQIFNTINFRCKHYNYNNNKISIQLLPFFFDGFITSFFTPICSGAKLVIPADNDLSNLSSLIHLIKEHKVTDLISIPSYFEQVMEIANPQDLNSINNVVVAGEKISSKFMELLGKNKNINFFNEYGLTETSVLCSVKKICKKGDKNNIGVPIINTNISIRNKHGEILPYGFIGEIVVEGVGVVCDNNSEKKRNIEIMNSNFIINSYNTGDYGYIKGNNIFYCFRKDTQLKVRGIRVDLSEVDSQIRRVKCVKDAAVINENGAIGAYIVLSNKYSEQEYYNEVRHSLPSYMIPDKTYFLKNIIRGISGKANLDFLKKERKKIEEGKELVLPQNKIQETIASIWRNILSIDKVGITDSYFELGGNSLNIIKLVAMLNNANLSDVEIKVMDIFEYPTIESLTKMLSNKHGFIDSSQEVLNDKLNKSKNIMKKNIKKIYERKEINY